MEKVKVWLLRRKGKRGVSYSIQWVDPHTGKRVTRTIGTDRAHARQKQADKRKELLRGLHTEITVIDYDQFAVEHLEQIDNSLSKATYMEHEHALRSFKLACHPKDLTVIDFQMLEEFRNARVKDGIRPATVNKSLMTMQAILGRAVKRGYLTRNPFLGNRKALFVPAPEPTPRILEPAEFDMLLAACPDDRWRGICLVAYHGGLRRGEITALRWCDVNFDDGTLRICNTPDHRTKSRRIRTVPMSEQVSSVLRTLQHARFRSEYVFLNTVGRRIVTNFDMHFRKIVRHAGLVDDHGKPRFSVHDLRRSCATELLRRGVNPKVVQKMLGHASIQTTMAHYVGVSDKDLRDAVKRFDKTG